jgi:hypothetical protein
LSYPAELLNCGVYPQSEEALADIGQLPCLVRRSLRRR